jgi:hypothetical protein
MDIRKYKVISAAILKNMGEDVEVISPPSADQRLFLILSTLPTKKKPQQPLDRRLAGPISRW